MRAVVQRVLYSSVTVGGEKVAEIGEGLNVLLGVSCDDDERDVKYLADKITGLRIFSDDDDKTNLSIFDVKAAGRDCGIIIVSQFTLLGDVRHGKRPAFTAAAEPARAEELYLLLADAVEEKCAPLGIRVGRGVFRADMTVEITNDGPFTILLDSKRIF